MLLGSKIVQLESEINVLEDFAIKTHCSRCLKHSENSTDLISCSKCSIMKYCSKSCLVRNLTLSIFQLQRVTIKVFSFLLLLILQT